MKPQTRPNKTIAWIATPEEQRIIELVKQKTKRKTTSDLMRYLVMKEAEFFLPRRTTNGVVEKVYGVK